MWILSLRWDEFDFLKIFRTGKIKESYGPTVGGKYLLKSVKNGDL